MTTFLNTETTVTLVPLTCGHRDCDAMFAFGQELYDRVRENHVTWYCPNGHPRVFNAKSQTQKLEAELAAARRIAESERELRRRETDRRERAERQRAAALGQVTKIKRRVGRGVCPCCNRTFADLGRHMTGQHPEFAGEDS